MMLSLKEQLNKCFNATDKELGFNLMQLIGRNTIEFECNGIYPTQEEIVFSNYDKNHDIKIKGEYFTVKTLPPDLNENQIKRTHIIHVGALHMACLDNFYNYIEYENFQNKSIVTTHRNFLSDFRKYYDIIINLCTDENLKRDYRRYWKEVSAKVSYAIQPETLFNATLNENSKQLIKSTLYSLYQSL